MARRTGSVLSGCRIGQPFAESFAFEKLHDQIGRTFMGANIEDGEDVGVIEGAGGASFLLEPLEALGILRERGGQDFYCDFAGEPRVPRSIDFTHPTSADGGDDFVRAELRARTEGHMGVRLYTSEWKERGSHNSLLLSHRRKSTVLLLGHRKEV